MSMRNRKIVQLSVESARKRGEIYGRKDLWKRNVLSQDLEWKSDRVMDGESGDDEGGEVTCERCGSGRNRWGRGCNFLLVISSNFGSILMHNSGKRYCGLKVENRQFAPTPLSFNAAIARGDPLKFRDEPDICKNYSLRLVKKSQR